MGKGGRRASGGGPRGPPPPPPPLLLLLGRGEVPPCLAESFILSGYRRPGYTLGQCLASAFRPTNETGNFWTHFLALFVFAFHLLEPFRAGGPGSPPVPALPASDPFYYPLWSYALGVGGLLGTSSLAHLLSSLSLPAREVCFYADYGAISAYTVGASLAYFYYIPPPAPAAPAPGWFEALYVPGACLVALFCTLACCRSRRRRGRHRYLVRTLVFLVPFLVVSLPVFRRLWQGGGGWGTGRLFLHHCLWLLASGVFNVGKIPERFRPGRFDIWGHSHQWFHCCSFMSILDELRMIRGEIQERGAGLPRAPTFLSTFGVMLLVVALLAGIVAWFGVRAHESHRHGRGSKAD